MVAITYTEERLKCGRKPISREFQNHQTTVIELWTDQFSFKTTFNLMVKTHVYTLTYFVGN